MKMPHVIPDLIWNPCVKDWIPAYTGMTMYFDIKLHSFISKYKIGRAHV